MIDLIIFDLDGVLVDTEQLHYDSLMYSISMVTTLPTRNIETVIHQDGTTTKAKLKILQKTFGTSNNDLQEIDKRKQQLVLQNLRKLEPNKDQIDMLRNLELLIPCLAIGSNSRKENVDTILDVLEIREFFSFVVTSDDVKYGKPNPEIFNKIIDMAGCKSKNTLILEDSVAGKEAALASGAHLLPINNIEETTLENIQHALYKHDSTYSSADGRTRFPVR